MLKLDLHVHTIFSGDALTRPGEAVLWAKRAGLSGLAITDHDSLRGAEAVMRLARGTGLLVIPGLEVESSGGHVLALGVSGPVRSGMSLAETVEAIGEAGGVSVLAHPFALFAPRKWSPEALMALDAIEVVNAREILFEFSRWMARRLASSFRKPMTGGSDAHSPEVIGMAYTLVEADSSVDDVLEAIRKGKTEPRGRRVPLRYLVKRWASVGLSASRSSSPSLALLPPELLV